MTSGVHDLLATEDILTLTQEVWASILDIPIEITQPENMSGVVLVRGVVEIEGPWSGTVTVACSRRLATMITAQMFEVAPAEASHDDIVDAVGEIANMIGGNVKALLPGPSTLGLPSVHVDHVAPPESGDASVTSWRFVTDGEQFVVTISATPMAANPSTSGNNEYDGASE
jgi:chemotaxis protein CheX